MRRDSKIETWSEDELVVVVPKAQEWALQGILLVSDADSPLGWQKLIPLRSSLSFRSCDYRKLVSESRSILSSCL